MASYYILQPLRDEIGLLLGTDYTPALFRWSLLAMLVANPLFAMLMARIPRDRLVPYIYRFFMLHLVLFVVAFTVTKTGQGQTLVQGWARLIPGLFYVWVSVFNLFAVSLFWSTMADRFSGPQGRKYFGFIGAGGTVGQFAGSMLATALVPWLGPTYLMLVSVALLELSVRSCPPFQGPLSPVEVKETAAADKPKPWSGVLPVLKSPYLFAICAYLFLYAFTSTFLYFQKQELVATSIGDRKDRVQFFSTLNLIGSVATVLVQLFVTGRFITSMGLMFSLALVPGVTVIGFGLMALNPSLMLYSFIDVTRKTLNYAIARPSREVLFTVVSKEEKYLSKNFIDTFVYRAGDAIASVASDAMKLGMHLGMQGISLAAVPCSLIWMAVAAGLGKAQRKKQQAAEDAAARLTPPAPSEIGFTPAAEEA